MAKTYRATQHWNHWLSTKLGRHVLSAEHAYLKQLLATYFGKHALLIGVPHQVELLDASVAPHHVLLTPLFARNVQLNMIEGGFYELPVLSGSVDLVLLPHSLEYADNPRQLLAEGCRIVKPEGHILIVGFNPWSFWGVSKLFSKSDETPWSMNFFPAWKIKKWLQLADFELVRQETILFSPPVHSSSVLQKFNFLEWLGRKIFKPFGSIYILVAKAKVIPLTPIRLRWQQQLSSVRVSIPGTTMRDSNR